ncbi:hypothetical protein BDZ89DRAFT_1026523 [Hymenopellis radicata]|nr:hypothetical protein BDZ89DRAFT_1026523 [Hymenopellis radicata]
MQDSLHMRKTGRNNISTGARGLILGNFPVYYEHLYDMAMQDNSPLYERDVIRSDKQDDNAAARVFSAAALESAIQNPDENLGLIVYLFVFGEFVDAFQSRVMPHRQRAKILLRTRLFMQTWKRVLKKQGYSEARYYISKQADDIFNITIDGLLGLMLIHRNHLPKDVPLLPSKHATMGNEYSFSAMRGISPDFALAQAVLILPHIHATLLARMPSIPDDGTINYALLSTFPTDCELTDEFHLAIEENTALWALVGVHMDLLDRAPDVPLCPPDVSLDADENDISKDTDDELLVLSVREQLQTAIDAIKDVSGLTTAEKSELEGYTAAAAALHAPDAALSLMTSLQARLGGPVQAPAEPEKEPTPLAEEPPLNETITSSDLEALVTIRAAHQTTASRVGVRNYKPSMLAPPPKQKKHDTDKPKEDSPPKEISPELALARAIHGVFRKAGQRGPTAGVNRRVRWTSEGNVEGDTVEVVAENGNSANAAVAAATRATDEVSRRRRLTQKLSCQSLVAEANISSKNELMNGRFVFIFHEDQILVGKVRTMYSKGAGKGGKYCWVPKAGNIGSVSRMLLQTFEQSFGRNFRRIHTAHSVMGLSRHAHIPPGSLLYQIDDVVKETAEGVELSVKALQIFRDLHAEKKMLSKVVASLNTIRRKGKRTSVCLT